MHRWLVLFLGLSSPIGLALAKEPPTPLPILLSQIKTEGPGGEKTRTAWKSLVSAGPSAILPGLRAMRDDDTVAANWIRTALDRIVDHASAKDLPLDALIEFAKDAKHAGRARRWSLDLVEQHRPGTSAKLFENWRDDPEFREEAIKVTLDRAKESLKEGNKTHAAELFRSAMSASRDIEQGRSAAAGLKSVGVEVSVADHLGFFRDWYLIGPFDGKNMKSFTTKYSPETAVDLKAELEGQKGKVRWIRHKTPETSSGRHQALVNLREKSALGDADDAVAFAYTEFESEKAQTVEMRGSADDHFTVYVNGERVFGFEEYRNGVRHDRHRFPVNLKVGKNTVLVKIYQTPAPNPEPNWEFFLRTVDTSGKGLIFRSLLR